jgi:hypothetical protein
MDRAHYWLLGFAGSRRAWCEARGLTVQILNDGHHWKISRPGLSAEWWPSSAKLVFNRIYKAGIHCHDWQQVARQIERKLMDVTKTKCAVHPDRPVTRALNVPCAPGGKLWMCDECHGADPGSDLRKQQFDLYFASHSNRVADKRADEQRRKGDRN